MPEDARHGHGNERDSGEEEQGIRADGGVSFSGYNGERPDDKDENEIFDLVLRQGPIGFDGLMECLSTYSHEEVSMLLSSLERKGFVEEREVETVYNNVAITNDKWFVVEDQDGE